MKHIESVAFLPLFVLLQAILHIEKQIPFARSDKLGNLTFCPTNLGTSLRASVHARIPKVAADKALFDKLCEEYGIQARGGFIMPIETPTLLHKM